MNWDTIIVLSSIIALGASATFYFAVKAWMSRRDLRAIDRIIEQRREAEK